MVTLLQSHVEPVVVVRVKVVVLGYWPFLELQCYPYALKVVSGEGFMPCVVCARRADPSCARVRWNISV
jgi:hypothetical protein